MDRRIIVLLVLKLAAGVLAGPCREGSTMVSTTDCPSITPSSTHRSTSAPEIGSGENYTMWQVFVVQGILTLNFSDKWQRMPVSLIDSKGHYETHHFNFTDNNHTMIYTSLALFNATVDPDEGNYIVHIELSNGCVSECSEFKLTIPDCNEQDPPEPSTTNVTYILAEPMEPMTWCTDVIYQGYHGDKSPLLYSIRWMLANEVELCSDDNPHNGRYTCATTDYGQCTTTSHFCIQNYTHADSHMYTTKAYPVDKGPQGRQATVNLDILPWPNITKWSSSYQTDLSHSASLKYEVANYSPEHVAFIVVRNDVEARQYHLSVDQETPDSTNAIVTLSHFSKSKSAEYKLCANFTEDVNTSASGFQIQCSGSTKVSSDKWEGQLGGVISGSIIGLVIIIIVGVVITLWCVRRHKAKTREDEKAKTREDEEQLLLNPATSSYTKKYGVPSHTLRPRADGRSSTVGRDSPERDGVAQVARPEFTPPVQGGASISHPPNPVRYFYPEFNCYLVKVTLIYPHNPSKEGYTQIELTSANEREVVAHDTTQRNMIRQHERLVHKFATFLKCSGVAVAYDQLLYDSSVSNRKMWFEQQMSDSDCVILIITQSFRTFLGSNKLPDEEYMFKGNFLWNSVIDNPSKHQFLPVFLNEARDTDLLPTALINAQSYEIWHPFDVQSPSQNNDDLVKLYRLLTKQTTSQKTTQLPPHIVHLPHDNGAASQGCDAVNDRPVSDGDILMLSQNASFSQYWKSIATNLGLTTHSIEQCEAQGKGDQDETCYQVLTTWRNNADPDQARLRLLAQAARDVNEELFDVVCQRH